MAFSPSGLTTGLLGFTLKKEFLGDGLFYRETEIYDYEIYSKSSSSSLTPFTEIQGYLKSAFSSNSGDINVKLLNAPADYVFPNDSIRVAKLNVQVEVRKPIANLGSISSELSTNYYKGIDTGFFNSYSTILDNFQEEFSFEEGENGNDVFNHNISFSLRSGGKSKATEIASGVFNQDKNTTFGINAMVGGATIADTATYVNYYTETYDIIKNSFSFSKKREVLPLGSSNYTYNLSHSLDFKDDGLIDVTEKGNIQGKLSFDQAKQGLGDLLANTYNRCNSIYTTYKNIAAGASVGESLVSMPIASNKVFNKPDLSIDYEQTFTNNPEIIGNRFISIDKIIEVDRANGQFININHTYNFFSWVSPIYASIDNDYISEIETAVNNSPTEVNDFYTNSVFYNAQWPTLKSIKISSITPNRKKNFSVSFGYTNNPTYFVTLDSVEYPILDFKITDVKPVDIINEYKVINRPSKTSVLNYAYQTERGSKSIVVKSKLTRVGNILNSPRTDISDQLDSLYRFAIDKVINEFVGINVISMTYFLSDFKYRINSDDDLELEMSITYTIKKYTV